MPSFLSDTLPAILNTLVLYICIILALRVFGHRQRSELSATELVVVMVLGSSVETGMVAGDKTLLAGLAAAGTLLVSNSLLSALMDRWQWLKEFLVGRPIPLVHNGKIISPGLRKAGLSEDDVWQGIRMRGYEKPEQVRVAMLEIDGNISVIPFEEEEQGQEGKE